MKTVQLALAFCTPIKIQVNWKEVKALLTDFSKQEVFLLVLVNIPII